MHHHTLTLAQEYAVIEAAFEAGVKVPRPYGYIADLAGREAFAMERLEGDTIGRRIVQKEELATARERLPVQLAEELAKIHAIPAERLPFLPGSSGWSRSSTRSTSRTPRSSSGSGGCARTARPSGPPS
jgi:aminoglycoside phosphotransferase (APT) family kinase protein